jgi:MtrB/PioB family decaheme-associated outer membrane protein
MNRKFTLIPVSAAVTLILQSAALANEELERQARPESTVTLGVGTVGNEDSYFSLYNGLDDGIHPLIDVDLLSRNDETGTWTELKGGSLGLDTRSFHFGQERQGEWSYSFDYGESTRRHPFVINTGLAGIGTENQKVSGGALVDRDFEMARHNGKLTVSRKLGSGYSTRISFRHDERKGDRPWGVRGHNFVAEPVDSDTEELIVDLGYAGDQMQWSAGYIMSLFHNKNEVLNSDAANSDGRSLSLPLDSESHQLYLTGGYNFTQATRGTLKLSRTVSSLDENFYTPATQAGSAFGRNDLDARVETTLVRAAIDSRISRDLSLNAYMRHEDRDDETPRYQYVTPSSSRDGFNVPFSRTTSNAGVQANYRVGSGYRVAVGFDHEGWERWAPPLRHASFREDTRDNILKASVRRSMSENINGSLGLSYGARDGSGYLRTASGNRIDPIHWGDRDRTKLKADINWQLSEALNLQAQLSGTVDDYDGLQELDGREGESAALMLDASYQINDEWQLTGWMSLSEVTLDQGTGQKGQVWYAHLGHAGRALGIGMRGEVNYTTEVGLDLELARDTSSHGISSSDLTVPDVPDIDYRNTTLRGFVNHPLNDDSGLRFDLSYQRIRTNDWTWNGVTYADGTTVTIEPDEKVTFVGVSYYYKWR